MKTLKDFLTKGRESRGRLYVFRWFICRWLLQLSPIFYIWGFRYKYTLTSWGLLNQSSVLLTTRPVVEKRVKGDQWKTKIRDPALPTLVENKLEHLRGRGSRDHVKKYDYIGFNFLFLESHEKKKKQIKG